MVVAEAVEEEAMARRRWWKWRLGHKKRFWALVTEAVVPMGTVVGEVDEEEEEEAVVAVVKEEVRAIVVGRDVVQAAIRATDQDIKLFFFQKHMEPTRPIIVCHVTLLCTRQQFQLKLMEILTKWVG
ncbi:hypothetical protein CRG98_003149 [Punica granatum]|uniref:Uncharacterized protein n=1 Tax=Punica granatum TaxID=22663 RepID=A0A2I0L6W9_PUNGR|nr:hypothetical protein CRG98_003149 [Punica granatum]